MKIIKELFDIKEMFVDDNVTKKEEILQMKIVLKKMYLKMEIFEIIKMLDVQEYEKANDFVDTIHCLPEIMLYKYKLNLKDYKRTYIQPFRKNGTMFILKILWIYL